MAIIGANQAVGHIVEMIRTNPGHMNASGKSGLQIGEDQQTGFGNLMAEAIGRVSDKSLEADRLFERMITNPDEVEPHDVTIAMAQAEMSLNLTKAIVDRAVKAYNDITGM